MTTVSDDFNRADGGLGSNWAVSAGSWTVTSNRCVQSATSARYFAAHQTALATDDNRSQATLVSGNAGLFVRGNAAATTGYFSNYWGGGHREIWKVVSGTATFLEEPASITDAGDLYMTVSGSTITIGVVGGGSTQTTDTSITTGKNVGLASDGNVATFDDFAGEDLPFDDSRKIADRGSAQNLTSQASTAVDMAAAASITVGNYLIARLALDNAGSAGAAVTLGVTDPRSNTWTIAGPANQDPGAANAGTTCYIAYAKVVNAYTDGDDITFDYSGVNVPAKAIVVEEWTGIHATTPVAVAATTATGASGTPSISRTPGATGQLFYGAIAIEGPAGDTYTQDSDTTDGEWKTLTSLSTTSGTAASNQTVRGASKFVTGTTAQTWNPTITSRDWAMVALVFAPAGAGGNDFTETPTDTEGLTDTRAFDHDKTLPADTLGLTDAATRAFDRPQVDNLGITDTVTAVLSREQSITDTLGLTDAIQTETSKAVAPADTLGLTDTTATVGDFHRTVTDELGLTDTLNISGDRTLDATDTLGLTDTAAVVGDFQRAVTENLGLTDSLIIDVGKLAQVDDTIGLTDTRALVVDANREPVETVGLTDTLTFELQMVLADTAGLTDTAALVATYARTITDTLGMVDERSGGVGLPDTNPLHAVYREPTGHHVYAETSHDTYNSPAHDIHREGT